MRAKPQMLQLVASTRSSEELVSWEPSLHTRIGEKKNPKKPPLFLRKQK